MVKKYYYLIFCFCFIFLRAGASAAISVSNFNELQNVLKTLNNADIEIKTDVLESNSNLFVSPSKSFHFNFKSASPSGKTLFDGGGLYSGFSFQNKSVVYFENMSFSQMSSYTSGASVSLINSSATFAAETRFYQNKSQNMGGAFEISASSVIFTGIVDITSNSARYDGGGFIVSNNSTLKFEDAVKMSANSSLSGGAFKSDASTVIFDSVYSQSVFEKNAVSFVGGAFEALNSNIFFNGEILFNSNSSGQYGGAGYFESSTGVFTNAKFYLNSAGISGGALYARSSYIIIKSTGGQKSVFEGNVANETPNSLSAQNSAIIFQSEAASSIEMRDGLSADENSVLIYEGEGFFELYGDMSQNYGNLAVASLNGGSFNINRGGVLNAKTLTNAAGSKIDAANNGQADIIAAERLINDGILSIDLGDKIKVENSVSLNGELEIFADLPDGDFRKAAYKMISYNGTIESSSAVLNVVSGVSFSSPSLLDYGGYFSNWITLILYGNASSSKLSSIDGLSFNQEQTAKVFDIISKDASGDMDAVISYIEGLSKNGARDDVLDALSQTSGYFIANAIRSASVLRARNILFDRIQKMSILSQNNKMWIASNFTDFTVSSDGEVLSGYGDCSSQIIAGYDIFVKNVFSAGFYAGYKNVLAKQNEIYEASLSNTSIGFYGGYFNWDWEVKAAFTGEFNEYSTKRRMPFIERTANADFNGNSVCASVESAYKIKISREIYLKPFAAINAVNSSYASFKETGAGSLNLHVQKGNYFMSDIGGGLGISQNNSFYNWQIRAESAFLLSGHNPEIESFFDGDETEISFKSRGNKEETFSFGVSAAADLSLSSSVKVYAGFGYFARGQSETFNITCGFAYYFASLKK